MSAAAPPEQAPKVRTGKRVSPEVSKIRMLAYFNAVRQTYSTWEQCGRPPLCGLLVKDEAERITKAVERHGRSTQFERLRMPIELFVHMLSFVSPTERHIEKMMSLCSMTLFLIMENDTLKHPVEAAAQCKPHDIDIPVEPTDLVLDGCVATPAALRSDLSLDECMVTQAVESIDYPINPRTEMKVVKKRC